MVTTSLLRIQSTIQQRMQTSNEQRTTTNNPPNSYLRGSLHTLQNARDRTFGLARERLEIHWLRSNCEVYFPEENRECRCKLRISSQDKARVHQLNCNFSLFLAFELFKFGAYYVLAYNNFSSNCIIEFALHITITCND